MRTSPRRIGLLGGITWHSTLDYERLLHEGVADALPGQTADLVIRHYNFGADRGRTGRGRLGRTR